MMRRRLEFRNDTKRDALDRAAGICECGRVPVLMQLLDNKPCGLALGTGNTFYEHIICDNLRPDNSLENSAVLVKTCWRLKTNSYDKPVIAKAKRQSDRHNGIKRTPSQDILGTKRSKVRKPFTGPPVWRDSGRPWGARR